MNLSTEDIARIVSILKVMRVRYNKCLTAEMRVMIDCELDKLRKLINKPQETKPKQEYGG